MAHWFEPRPDQKALWLEWVTERPDSIRAVAERFHPWELYKLTSTGQIVTVASFSEPGEDGRPTIRVNIIGHSEHDLPMPVYGVFGLDADELEVYEPRSKAELIFLARRAAGEG